MENTLPVALHTAESLSSVLPLCPTADLQWKFIARRAAAIDRAKSIRPKRQRLTSGHRVVRSARCLGLGQFKTITTLTTVRHRGNGVQFCSKLASHADHVLRDAPIVQRTAIVTVWLHVHAQHALGTLKRQTGPHSCNTVHQHNHITLITILADCYC